jgi:leucyl-tRNA synthetase
MKDMNLVVEEEPFKKLINQGMIQGRSNFVYRLFYQTPSDVSANLEEIERQTTPIFVSFKFTQGLFNQDGLSLSPIDFEKIISQQLGDNVLKNFPLNSSVVIRKFHVDVNLVENDVLNIQKFKESRLEYANAEFILENGKYICGHEVEKMSKSKFNVVNPDDLIARYGADTLRMYEMFLGPLEQSKPWNTNGIEGVFKFLRKFWRLFHNDQWVFTVSDAEPSKAELKSLHKIIRKVEEDVERFSFNTSVSSFMIAVNELTDLKCNNKSILQDMVIILSSYAPHICEELWTLLGNEAGTLSYATYPKFNGTYLIEDEFAYPISINGKTKMNLSISLSLNAAATEAMVLANADVQRYLDGKLPKKVIVVMGRIVNMVV